MFQQPRESGDKTPIAEMIGSLVLIVVHEHRTGIITTLKPQGTDAVACDVHCLDGKHGGTVFEDSLLFQGALVGALKGAAGGEPVLGRIGQGVAKPAQNPPYILIPFTEQDAAIAGPYWARVQANKFQQAPTAAPAVPTPAAPVAPAVPAAASPYPVAASPATASAPVAPAAPAAPAPSPAGAMTAAAFLALPLEVQTLLRQSGQAPAGV